MDFFAYVDAGTGSLFIQAILGVVLAAGVFFRTYFGRAYGKVRETFSRNSANDKE